MDMNFAPDTNRLVVRFEIECLERHLTTYLGHELDDPIVFKVPFSLGSPGGRTWQSLTSNLAQTIDQDVNILQSPLVATHYEQLLTSVLLHSQFHNYWEELHETASPAAPYYVKRAVCFMREHADEAITMNTLVELSGVSARSLYAGFQQFEGTTPMAYLKNERLCGARDNLLTADPAQTTVTEIATKWHFYHLGRFAGDYRKAFGESPSATLKRNIGKIYASSRRSNHR